METLLNKDYSLNNFSDYVMYIYQKIKQSKMNLFKSKFFLLFFFVLTTLAGTTFGQTKENKNFKAGITAYEKNNIPLAFQKFQAAAKEGHVDSQFNLGLMYEKGIGVVRNEKEAVAWYGKAAAQGNAPAQYNLGVMCENGRGTPVNFALANKWYRKASVQGDGLAIGNLGMLYIRGQGVKENKVAGVALLLLSAKIENSPENTAKKNISSTSGLSTAMVAEAQELLNKMSNTSKMMTPLDQYLKNSENTKKK